MKKIVAIIGSPRKGETYKAVEGFENALKKMQAVEVEYVMLSKVGLQECTGCHNCIMKGREMCREARKVEELRSKMKEADAVILATPVYNQQVTALMKKFLDYFTYQWHRPDMFGVKFFGMSSGGGMFQDVFRFLKTNAQSWGGTWIGELGVPHYDALTPKFKGKFDKDRERKAMQFLKALEGTELPSPNINRLMMFGMWKLNAVACKDSNPADFAWWTEKDLLDKKYYYPVRIGVFRKIAAGIIGRIAKSFMRKVYVGYDEV